MSKHKQRQASAYNVGQKIGKGLAFTGALTRPEFNKGFAKLYTGRRAFQPVAFLGAHHGFFNQRELIKNAKADADSPEKSNAVL